MARREPICAQGKRRSHHLGLVAAMSTHSQVPVVRQHQGHEAGLFARLSVKLGDQGVGDVDGSVCRIWHQKYPSCFFFSMLASPPSLSMIRPCLSLVVVSSIS